eukprot:TRINITY_DN12164_c0_g1_i1.p1 TRINITY_DN12164_c0_g1~~TRINITY_DN12164_c0_g1_i1.p1  ORF type:complete len:563 (-),score=124.73 TRINITY_DN12164_c0_g1_i1:14-1702(-)
MLRTVVSAVRPVLLTRTYALAKPAWSRPLPVARWSWTQMEQKPDLASAQDATIDAARKTTRAAKRGDLSDHLEAELQQHLRQTAPPAPQGQSQLDAEIERNTQARQPRKPRASAAATELPEPAPAAASDTLAAPPDTSADAIDDDVENSALFLEDLLLDKILDTGDVYAVRAALSHLNFQSLTKETAKRVLTMDACMDDYDKLETHLNLMPSPDAQAFHIVIEALVNNGDIARAAPHLARMFDLQVRPFGEHVAWLFTKLSRAPMPSSSAMHKDWTKVHFEPSPDVTLIVRLFEHFGFQPSPRGYEQLDAAFEGLSDSFTRVVFIKLLKSSGVRPTDAMFKAIMRSAAVDRKLPAQELLTMLSKLGFEPTVATNNALINAMLPSRSYPELFELLDRMIMTGEFDSETLLLGIKACGVSHQAQRIPDLLEQHEQLPGVDRRLGYHHAIQAYVLCNDFTGVRRLLNDMRLRGVTVTYATARRVLGVLEDVHVPGAAKLVQLLQESGSPESFSQLLRDIDAFLAAIQLSGFNRFERSEILSRSSRLAQEELQPYRGDREKPWHQS